MPSPPRAAILAALLGLAGASRAMAQADVPSPALATTLSLAAEGEARVAPDTATLSLATQTTAPSASDAMAANAQAMTRVLAALRRAGIAERDLQTSSLSLSPQEVYEQGKPPRLTGYQASNRLIVTVRKLDALGTVVDAAAEAGATSLAAVNFGFANPASAQNSARLAAVKALEDKASLYAQAVGYHIVRLVSLSEDGFQGRLTSAPIPLMLAQRVVGAPPPPPPPPVEAGETTVRVAVTGVFELGR
jgi:hypothetical protein